MEESSRKQELPVDGNTARNRDGVWLREEPVRRPFRRRALWVGLLSALVVGSLFLVYAAYAVRATGRSLLRQLERQSLTLLEALVSSAEYATDLSTQVQELERKNLLEKTGLIRMALARSPMQVPRLQEIQSLVQGGEVDGIIFVPPDKPPIGHPAELVSRWMEELQGREAVEAPQDIRQPIIMTLPASELQPGWAGAGVFDPTRDGWITVWDKFEMVDLLGGELGVRRMVEEIGRHTEIRYIFLQGPRGVIFSSGQLEPILKIKDDPFLVSVIDSNRAATREVDYAGRPVLEAVRPFLHPEVQGVFRVGLRLDSVIKTRQQLTQQMVISGVFLVLLTAVGAGFAASRRSLTMLGASYKRIRTLTGQVLDSMDQAVVVVDHQSRISVLNPAAESMLGVSAERSLGKTLEEVFGKDEKPLFDAFSTGAPVIEQLWTYQRSGRIHRFVLSATPIIEAPVERQFIKSEAESMPGTTVGAMAVIRDETATREMEQKVRHAERLSEMGTLAAGVAHEIRNPLNSIALAAHRLRSEFEVTRDAEEFRSMSGTILSEIQRLNGIVEGFLSLARKSERLPENIDLQEVASEAAGIAEFEGQSKGVTVSASRGNEKIVIRAIADEIKKVVWNLLKNALAACNTGGRVDLNVQREGNYARLQIVDTGKGIAPDELERVFQPYYTTKPGGTGLGLAIAHRIVTDHHGDIKIDSELGSGTTITVRLPLVD